MLVGNAFLERWGSGADGWSLSDLFFVIRTLMPPGRVRDLSPEQDLNALAYILQRNGYSRAACRSPPTKRGSPPWPWVPNR